MLYSDLLYPGNPRRRRQVEDLYEQMCQKVPLVNAGTVDNYMDHIKGYMHRQLGFLEGGEDNGLQQACESLLAHTGTIQEKMHMVDNALKQQLTSDSYRKLQGIHEPWPADPTKICTNLVVGLWIFTVVMTVVNVFVFCHSIPTLIQFVPLAHFVQVNAALLLILAAVCVCFGVDVLLSTALGSWEKHRLKQKIEYYEFILATMSPV